MQITSDLPSPQTSPSHSIQDTRIRRRCSGARSKSSDSEYMPARIMTNAPSANPPQLPSGAVVLSPSSTSPPRPVRAILPPPQNATAPPLPHSTAPPLPPRPTTKLQGQWASRPYKVLGKNPPPPPPKEELSTEKPVQPIESIPEESIHEIAPLAQLKAESSSEMLSSFLETAQATIQENQSLTTPPSVTVHAVAAQVLPTSPKEAASAAALRRPSITLTKTVDAVVQGALSNPSNEAVHMSTPEVRLHVATPEVRLPSAASTSTAFSAQTSPVSSSMGTVSASYTSSTSSSVREAANSGFFAHRAEQGFAPQQRLIADIQVQQKGTLGCGDTENDNRLKEFDALDTTFRQQERDLTQKLQTIGAFKLDLANNVKAIYGEGYQCNEKDKQDFAEKTAYYEKESKSMIDLRGELQKTSVALTQHIAKYAKTVNPQSANLAELALKLGISTQSYLKVEKSWKNLNNEWIRQKSILDTAIQNFNQNDAEIRTLLTQFQQRVAPEERGYLDQFTASITGSINWVMNPFGTGPNTTPFTTTTTAAKKPAVAAAVKV